MRYLGRPIFGVMAFCLLLAGCPPAAQKYTLTYTAGANGAISGVSPQSVSSGASGTEVTAVPNAGYRFVSWSDGSTQNPRTDTNVAANISVTAGFTRNITTPTVTAWPAASAITYGQTLAASTLTGGAASVDGTFVFAAPDTAPDTGTFTAPVKFTPADTSAYTTVSGTTSVTVGKATPRIITWPVASAITYGQTLTFSVLSGAEVLVSGILSFAAPATMPGAGTYTADVTFTPMDSNNYTTASGTTSVIVYKATPKVTFWPTAIDITYGQTLAASTLTGGAVNAAGTFAFAAPNTAPAIGNHTVSVMFTPEDAADYNTVSGTASVTVDKATPTVTAWPTASAITYGQSLAASTLTEGAASVPGTFAFAAPAGVPNIGTCTASVIFTPADTTDYKTVSGTAGVPVGKATPTVTVWPTATAITYGQTLAHSALTGSTVSVSGVLEFTAPTTVPGVGTYTADVTFTPVDTTHYNTVSGTVSVTVNKATPAVTAWPAADAITYGQTLAASTLTGGTASAAGTFAFAAPDAAPGTGTCTASVTFTPTDTVDYNTVSGTVNVTVGKATPTVTAWPTASAINYGQTLASSILTGGAASVPGTFAFTVPNGIPDAGTTPVPVKFTPTDTADYTTVSDMVNVSVGVKSFVKPGGTGNGSSWDNALGSIQSAADTMDSVGGGEVWVAAGTYTAAKDPVVQLRPHVAVYGGFTGTETSRDARDWEANTTIIDGQSARRCVIGENNATLDGFTVRKGHASGNGGGMYNTVFSPTVANCTFAENNAAADGGGICNEGASPTFDNCAFSGNTAMANGGAMYNISSEPTLAACSFTGNSAPSGNGGAMYNAGGGGTMTNCDFARNTASSTGYGGGIVNHSSSPTVTDCTFDQNSAGCAGGMYNYSSSTPTVTNCTFTLNGATTNGGGMCNQDSSPRVDGCDFTQNEATSKGGGMCNQDSSPTVTDCTFTGNAASSDGGGMCNQNSSPTVDGCTFRENTADYAGGMLNSSSASTVKNCTFAKNAAGYAGGIYNHDAEGVTVTNCVFVGNTAAGRTTENHGGGMCNDGSSPTIMNCTFAGNSADYGGAMVNQTASPSVTNCILWGDSAASEGNEIYNILPDASATVTYSCIKGGSAGTGNISTDPLFENADDGNVRLQAGSPCIDEGTETGAPDTDIDDTPRTHGAGCDMGAYEYSDD